MSYNPFKPNWFYNEFDILNLEQIQREFEPLAKQFNQREIVFTPQKKEQFEQLVPSFVQWLKSVDLYDRWFATAFGLVPPQQSYPPHIDSTNADIRSQALNIPIANCQGTHTIWYRARILGLIWGDLWSHVDPSLGTAATCSDVDTEELCRVEVVRPMVINVTIPHAVENFTDQHRFLVSTRFDPELTAEDLFRLGVKQPYIQDIPREQSR